MNTGGYVPHASRAIPAAIREAAADWVSRRDASLRADEERELQEWLAADPRHAAGFARLSSAWRALDRPLRTGTAGLVLGELGVHASRRTRRRQFAAAAGALALLAAGGVTWQTRDADREPAVEREIVATTAPARQMLRDGSRVDLDDGGEIVADFNERTRRVTLLRGEAHFQVAHEAARPFVVVAGSLEVRAVGTAFTVQLRARTVEVVVASGMVALDLPAQAGAVRAAGEPMESRTLVTLEAGSGMLVDLPTAAGRTPTLKPLPPAVVQQRMVTLGPRLEFSGTPLGEAVTELNRHNRVQFVVDDPELAAVRVSGVFGAHHTEAFIQALETSFNVSVERRGEYEFVLRRAK